MPSKCDGGWPRRGSAFLLLAAALAAALLWVVPSSYGQETATDLAGALNRLESEILKKIDADVELTVTAFSDSENIWRSLRTAYIAKTPLTVIEGAISVAGAARDLRDVNTVKQLFKGQRHVLGVASIATALASSYDAGQKLQFALDGPTYSSAVQGMIDSARKTQKPLAGYPLPLAPDFDAVSYKRVIQNWVSGSGAGQVLCVVQKQPILLASGGSAGIGWQKQDIWRGTDKLKRNIRARFSDLTGRITSASVDPTRAGAAAELLGLLTKGIARSRLDSSVVRYSALRPQNGGTFQPVSFELHLGLPASYEILRRTALEGFDKDVRWEQTTTAVGAVTSSLDLVILTGYCAKVAGKRICDASAQVLAYEGLAEFAADTVFESSARQEVVNIPQQMLLGMSTELSNLLVALGDAERSVQAVIREPVRQSETAVAFPRFAPDGQKVAFVRYNTGPKGDHRICIVDLLPNRTACFPETFSWPTLSDQPFRSVWQTAFTPDGTRLLFDASTTDYKCGAMFSVRLDGTALRSIGPCRHYQHWALAPDGKTFAYISISDHRIHWTDLEGRDLHVFPRDVDALRGPIESPQGTTLVFTPDGQRLLYLSDRAGLFNFYLQNLRDGTRSKVIDLEPESLVAGRPQRDTDIRFGILPSATISRTGWTIAFVAPVGSVDPANKMYRAEQFELFTVGITGGTRTRLTHDSSFDDQPVITADGSRVVFLSSTNGKHGVHVIGGDGTGRRMIAESGEYLAISPDGKRVAFTAPDGKEIRIVGLDGSGLVRIPQGPFNEIAFATTAPQAPVRPARSSDSPVLFMIEDDRRRISAITESGTAYTFFSVPNGSINQLLDTPSELLLAMSIYDEQGNLARNRVYALNKRTKALRPVTGDSWPTGDLAITLVGYNPSRRSVVCHTDTLRGGRSGEIDIENGREMKPGNVPGFGRGAILQSNTRNIEFRSQTGGIEPFENGTSLGIYRLPRASGLDDFAFAPDSGLLVGASYFPDMRRGIFLLRSDQDPRLLAEVKMKSGANQKEPRFSVAKGRVYYPCIFSSEQNFRVVNLQELCALALGSDGEMKPVRETNFNDEELDQISGIRASPDERFLYFVRRFSIQLLPMGPKQKPDQNILYSLDKHSVVWARNMSLDFWDRTELAWNEPVPEFAWSGHAAVPQTGVPPAQPDRQPSVPGTATPVPAPAPGGKGWRKVEETPLPSTSTPAPSPATSVRQEAPKSETALPSGSFQLYTGARYTLAYPTGWISLEINPGMTMRFAPETGLIGGQGKGAGIGFGMLAGFFNTDIRNLREATQKFVTVMARSNPEMRLVNQAFERGVLAGAPSESLLYEVQSSLFPGERESVWVVTTRRPPGVFYVMFITPQRYMDRVLPTYRQILACVQLK